MSPTVVGSTGQDGGTGDRIRRPAMPPHTKGIIVVIDDDEVVRESFRAVLEARRFEVEDFQSGRDFLVRRDGGRLGCIILDIHMPGMNGLELLESLRRSGDATPVLLVTGRSDARVLAQAQALGASTLLEKPVRPDQLFQAIEQALAAG
jgi:FixJ family two-component response regulator